MIASLQYAIDYRPYILKGNKDKAVDKTEEVRKAGKPSDLSANMESAKSKNPAPQLLKANDNKVVDYMRTVANSVNDMKFSVKTLTRSVSRYATDYYKNDELVKEFIEEDVEEFARALNSNFRGSLSTELSSGNIDDYLGKIQQSLATNMNLISNLGIEIENGQAVVAGKPKDYDKIKENIDEYVDMFSEINDTTNEMLSKSIYEHVKFRDMKLFVNYNFNSDRKQSFELFTEGIVLDVAV